MTPPGWQWPGADYSNPIKLALFIHRAFDGLVIPSVRVCPGHSSPWEAFLDSYYSATPVVVWKASRGFGGKSFLLSLLGDVQSLTLGIESNILGGSGQQSKRVLEAITTLHGKKNYPRGMIRDESLHVTRYTNGAKLQALMASQASVRGPHPQRLLLDEIDEMELDIFDAAMGQPMDRDGIAAGITASSTHQHAFGTMTEVRDRARKRGWKYHEWCYRETMRTEQNPWGWLMPEEVERKKLVISDAMWRAEYEGQDPNPEDRAMSTEKVEAMFDRALGEHNLVFGKYYEFEPPDYKVGIYGTGADWARKVDNTVIATFRVDCKPARLVAVEILKRSDWPFQIDRFEKRLKRYPGRAAHDGTGIGDVIHGMLKGSRAESVILSGKERYDLLTEYVKGVENGEIKAPMVDKLYDDHKYASVDDMFKSGDGHHLPDTICALALAYRAGLRRSRLAWAHA